ncbi:MAG: WD40 repeat domain-containing protein [Cyanobacteria bacterium J06623_7]
MFCRHDDLVNGVSFSPDGEMIASASFVSLSVISMPPASANLLDEVSNASVSVLSKLGYDCKTASAGGILCTKCKADGFKQKCEAFTCDAVTKKCRRKTATLPNIPGSNNSDRESEGNRLKLPSL